jgi:hypothetical protein
VLCLEGFWGKSRVVLLVSLGEMEEGDDNYHQYKPQACANGMGCYMVG